MDQNPIRAQLQELSASGGGSLVKRVVKSSINSNTYVLFVGLGGMGCKTVNAIKDIYIREFAPSPQVKFLAVDTDETALNSVNVNNGGRITADESFPIYSQDGANLLIERPPVVAPWLSSDVPAVVIDPYGAQATRAIGRVMLCGTNKYEALRATISGLVDRLAGAVHNPVTVVLVAGISGGTGSGTFIDVGYMIRMLLTEKRNMQKINSDFYGVFYTPDVQQSIPEVGGNPDVWANLQRNGYAAMKELDYFVNVGSLRRGTEIVYSITLPTGTTYQTSEPILSPNKVFMISASAGASDCEDIVEMTSSSLLNMFQTGTAADGAAGSQSVLSTMSNVNATLATWVANNVGQPGNEMAQDPCGIKNCPFPAFMNYNFATFGYRSIYFPRNEMVAYCANQAFTMVYDVWKRAFSFNQEFVNAAAKACRMDSLDAIYDFAIKTMNIDTNDFRIGPNDPCRPIRKGLAVMGHMVGLDATVERAKAKVDTYLKALTIPPALIDTFVTAVKGNVEAQSFLQNYGPYGGLVLLNGNAGANVQGFIQLLTKQGQNLSTAQNKKIIAMNEAANAMNQAQAIMASDNSPHDEEIEVFIDACLAYSKAYFEEEFFRRFMGSILQKLIEALIAYNNQTFDIYVPIIEAVKDILNEDAAAFGWGTLWQADGHRVYELNAYNLNQANQMNHLFQSVFDGYADMKMAAGVNAQFINNLFGPSSRDQWAAYIGNPTALADAIRGLFASVTKPLISNMLEKFIVVVYGDPNRLAAAAGQTSLTVADVNRIWEDNALRTNALRDAASNIVNTLSNSLMISFSISPQESQKFSRSCSVRLLAETPNLNAAIAAELTNTFGTSVGIYTVGDDTTCEYKTAITMTTSCSSFALPLVQNMNHYAEAYYAAERVVVSSAGRHLNEVSEAWQTYLPELYGTDAEEYYLNMWQNGAMRISDDVRKKNWDGSVKNNDKELYAKIRQAVDYGIRHGYIYLDGGHKYQMLELTDTSGEFIAKIEDTLIDLRMVENGATWLDALKKIEDDIHYTKHRLIQLDARFAAGGLSSRQHINPNNEFELKNVYRLVRADMANARRVIQAREFFEQADFFYNMDNMAVCGEVAKLFIQAYKYGLITYNEENHDWVCTYSDNRYDKPVVFFHDAAKKIKDFDEPFSWYLVFSAFSEIVRDEAVAGGIRDFCGAAEETGADAIMCKPILESMEEALSLPIFRARDTAIRDNELERCYALSSYQKYYSFPKRYAGPDTLIFNLKQFVSCLKELDRFLGL